MTFPKNQAGLALRKIMGLHGAKTWSPASDGAANIYTKHGVVYITAHQIRVTLWQIVGVGK
jgi:hypothetical protein